MIYSNLIRYERLERLGEGAYGKVYRARNRNTQEIVALKKFRTEVFPFYIVNFTVLDSSIRLSRNTINYH